jgi:hypothetical protein
MAAHTDLRQIRYVTANYQQVQGLRNVAYGAAFVAGGLVYALVPSAPWAIAAAMWVGIALNWLIGRYYQRTFGQVDPAGSEWGSTPYAARIPIVLGGFILIVAAVVAGLALYVLLGLFGLAWSIGYALYLHRRGGLRLRPYWAVACAITAAVSLAILLPLPALAPLHHTSGMRPLLALYLVPMGLAMIVCGLLDHRLLLRTFAPEGEN